MNWSTAQRRSARVSAALAFGLAVVVPTSGATSFAEPTGCTIKYGAAPPASVPWAQQRLGFDKVQALATGAGITIAVVDSGLSQDHPQTGGITVEHPTNVMGRGRPDNVYDCEEFGHGTGVTSVIAAPAQEGLGFEGLAPGVTVVPVKFFDTNLKDEIGSDSKSLARGIEQAIADGVDIINLSLQTPDTPELRAAMEHARQQDIVVVAASGNLREDTDVTVTYPAQYAAEKQFTNMIAVGAVDAEDQVAEFSIRGDYVGVAAPGKQVMVPTQAKGYVDKDGTSFAAPFVSATAALVLERHPDLSASEVVNRIKATADRPGVNVPDDGYGWGVVNPYLAVTAERDDSRILPKADSPEQMPAPDLPEPADHTLRNQSFAISAGLLGAGVLVVIGNVAWRRTAERRRQQSQRPEGSGA